MQLSLILVCLTQVNCHPLPKKNLEIQWNCTLAKHEKTCGHEKIAFYQVFTYSYCNPLWIKLYRTNWIPNMITAKDLNSTNTNNFTWLVTQSACVLYHKAHTRRLNQGTSASSLIAEKMHSLHNKLRRHDIMVGKCKQVHVLTAGPVSISHKTYVSYSWVLSAWQDLLTNIYHLSMITWEY